MEGITYRVVLEGLESPTHLAYNSKGDIFVADQLGYVYQLDSSDNPWLDITDRVLSLKENDESGLLSIAFTEEDDIEDVFLFSSRPIAQVPENITLLNYESPDIDMNSPDLHIDVLSSIPVMEGEALVDEEIIYFGILRDQRNHHGGKLLFSSGDLYITIGDGGPQKDPFGRGQDLNSVFGKILLITPNTNDGTYNIPEKGAVLSDSLPEIYAYGFRNPWSLTEYIDPSGERILFVADVGYESWEWIVIVERGSNYGWNIMEGGHPTSWSNKSEINSLTFASPIFSYPHSKTGISAIIGGFYVACHSREQCYPEGYYFADISGDVMRIKDSNEGWKLDGMWNTPYKIQAWGEDSSGFLYLLVVDQGDGKILRLEYIFE